MNSRLVLIVSGIVFLIVILNLGNHKRLNVIKNDVISSYSYLPATFIKQDLRLRFLNDSDYVKDPDEYWSKALNNGNHVFKTTMGLSMLYAPFFLIAHIYALLFDYDQNGFSEPYQLAISQIGRAHV